MNYSTSIDLFSRARQVIPGGVNSPVRAFGAVGGTPIFFESAAGAHVVDVDGNSYVDYVGSWGPFILGHGDPRVIEAIREQALKATSFGAPSRLEVELAELLASSLPGLEMVRLVSSGTEATMSAIRVARGVTGREKVVKFEGCYHGHGDSFLIRAGSGMLTHGAPSSPGVTAGTAGDTLVATFNDIASFDALFEENPDSIAAVIIEPIGGNMGVVPAERHFLEHVRGVCTTNGSLLVFDEVMTGYRVGPTGAGGLLGVPADLITLGKIIGGGLPVGAYGGRREFMEVVSPVGSVYQAGTLSGNPLAVAAGLATLRILLDEKPWDQLEITTARLETALVESSKRHAVPMTVNRVGSMMTPFFTDRIVTDYGSATTSHTGHYAHFFHAMLDRGIYLPPSQFESWFVSTCHGQDELAATVQAIDEALGQLAAGGGSRPMDDLP